ncbi:uncharacterized protein [Eurosta solidaginis]|uniref:uncharacterized protein n=1 Tax=Eurosta solidaginis TaxID=178769 RepID=UPI003530A729
MCSIHKLLRVLTIIASLYAEIYDSEAHKTNGLAVPKRTAFADRREFSCNQHCRKFAKSFACCHVNNNEKYTHFERIINKINKERRIDTIFIQKQEQTANNVDSMCTHENFAKNVPIFWLSPFGRDYPKASFNTEVLTIACLSEVESSNATTALLDALAKNLNHMRQTRIIFLLHSILGTTSNNFKWLTAYLKEQQMLNVLIFLEDFHTSGYFYRYQPFPYGYMTHINVNSSEHYFIANFTNLHERRILTLPDQLNPRTVLYTDGNGNQQLSGYVGYLIKAFAKKFNATLQLLHPVAIDDIKCNEELINLTDKRRLDLPITVVLTDAGKKLHHMSYPFEFGSWMVIVPCPRHISYAEIPARIISTNICLILLFTGLIVATLDALFIFYVSDKRSTTKRRHNTKWFLISRILFNDKVFRAILGQPSVLRTNYITVIHYLFILGVFINNLYAAYYETLLTTPPLTNSITQFEDFLGTNLKIMMVESEVGAVKLMMGPEYERLMTQIIESTNMSNFLRCRYGYNTNYAYSISEAHWAFAQLQQQFFAKQIFCAAPNLQLRHILMLSIPMQENSEFKALLDQTIIRVIETGLMDHWKTLTFYDMVNANITSLADISNSIDYKNMKLSDMKLMVILLLSGFAASFVVFCIELLIDKVAKSKIII